MVATGGIFVVAGAAVACSVEPEPVFVAALDAKPARVLVAAVRFGKVVAMAATPRALAAPVPRVMADTQASPLLRARCRVEAEVGELVMVLQSRFGGCGMPRCSWFMRSPSNTRLCGPWALPLNCL